MASAEVRVEVVAATAARRVQSRAVALPSGSTVADALRASGLLDVIDDDQRAAMVLGCWGQACAPEAVLRDGDRVELTRALQVDPKEARRLRYRRDGLRRAARR